MPRECECCGTGCGGGQTAELSRREFMGALAAGAAGFALAGELAWAGGQDARPTLPPPTGGAPALPLTPPRVYKGRNLQAVAMPIGGIGTGTIWLDGQGRLAVWQIFNNFTETRIPDSFLAVRARPAGGQAVTRVLQTAAEGSLAPVQSLEYEGGYPIARLTFHDADLPVEVMLEAFNPMIPLDAASSSIPCAIFRVTARNAGKTPVEVALAATCQNAVGSRGAGGVRGVSFGGYGGNRNRAARAAAATIVAMDKSPDPPTTQQIKVRSAGGPEVPGPAMVWLAGQAAFTNEAAERMNPIVAEGGAVLADGISADFLATLKLLRSDKPGQAGAAEVFEDFERDNYDGWTITGAAFGKRPARGTLGSQQPVSGFAGRGLVNTFIRGDEPQGTATSKKFKIQRRYIGFLIGGGGHRDTTCINLRVGEKVLRTACGKNKEELEPASWDVADLKGQEAVIEIVDRNSGPWGHINIDQIIFSDAPPEALLRQGTPADSAARAIALAFTAAEEATLPAAQAVTLTDHAPAALKPIAGDWKVAKYTRLSGFRAGEGGYRVLAATGAGEPLLIEGPLGKGRIVLALAGGLPWSWGSALLVAARGQALKDGERLAPGDAGWGTMALACAEPETAALPAWTSEQELAAFLAEPAKAARDAGDPPPSKPGQTLNAALAVPFTLQGGQARTASFILAWHFPNVQRFQHAGNLYNRRWADAAAVARHVADNLPALWQRTNLYHQTVYQSNLPEEFLDAMTSQSVIFRGPTCWWSEDGYFGGFEGCYGCCPLNCTHVWNYAQTHARLFPEVGRNMRISNFVTFLHEDGETSHREHKTHNAFIDGHCACIEGALREHQLSADDQFLRKVWPGVKKAVDWLIAAIDKAHDGMPTGQQWNTYDTAVSGANTFIGSQYLAALAAGEAMARLMGDGESAARWQAVRQAGMRNQNERLWSGEYYIQVPGPTPARDYNTGCHADQLLGQWWAHMLGLGYLYPPDRVKAALAAVAKHNFRENFAGFKQIPRRYVIDEDGGLIICTWPHEGRPKSFILYADEVWTGIEYAAAGAMVYEGLIAPARQIVRVARARYDGRRREGLNSGPGGNPFNELECGKFYARAMSSWSLLIAAQGLILDGPAGVLGFKPRWQPEDHRSFFTAPEGWGLFIQQRQGGEQTERIEVRHGKLSVKELVFDLPNAAAATATVRAAGKPVKAAARREGTEIRLALAQPAEVAEGEAIEVVLKA